MTIIDLVDACIEGKLLRVEARELGKRILCEEFGRVRKEAYEDGRNIERIGHEKAMRSMVNQLRMWQIIANILHEDACKASS